MRQSERGGRGRKSKTKARTVHCTARLMQRAGGQPFTTVATTAAAVRHGMACSAQVRLDRLDIATSGGRLGGRRAAGVATGAQVRTQSAGLDSRRTSSCLTGAGAGVQAGDAR